jgi:hypothetical protein
MTRRSEGRRMCAVTRHIINGQRLAITISLQDACQVKARHGRPDCAPIVTKAHDGALLQVRPAERRAIS